MRLIDRIALRHVSRSDADVAADTFRERRNAHYIQLARFMADCGVDSVAALKASEKREYDRRLRAIDALGTAPSTLTLNAARMALLNRSHP